MVRKVTETFDPMDFLLFSQRGNASILVPGGSNGPGLDFETFLINGVTFYPIWISDTTPSRIKGGFFHYIPGSALATIYILAIYHDSTVLGYLRMNAANNKLEILMAPFTTANVIGTVNYALETLHHIQFDFHVNAAGTFEVKLDEDLDVLTFSGNTTNGGMTHANRVELPGVGSKYDSFYVNDTVGVIDNTYGGVIRMKSFVPVADGFYSDWLRTSGAQNFAMIDETPHDSDTTVCYTTVNGDRVSVAVVPHGLTSPSVLKAVSARWVVRKVSNGRVRPFFRIGGVNYPIAAGSVPVGVGYTCITDRRTENPATGLPWALGDTIDDVGLEAII